MDEEQRHFWRHLGNAVLVPLSVGVVGAILLVIREI